MADIRERVERTFSPGAVATDGSLADEVDPQNHAQTVPEITSKVSQEARANGGGLLGWIRSFWHHQDRELSGEYERREDPTAPPPPAT